MPNRNRPPITTDEMTIETEESDEKVHDVSTWLAKHRHDNRFLASLHEQLTETGSLSPRQIEVIEDAMSARFVGNVGDKIDVIATLRESRMVTTSFGQRRVDRFEADGGGVLTVWASPTSSPLPVARVRIKGTIASNRTWDGQPESRLRRATVTPA